MINEFISQIEKLQVLLLSNGGNMLNIEVDGQLFNKLKYDFTILMRYVDSNSEDKPTSDKITLYGPMCKTIIRKIK